MPSKAATASKPAAKSNAKPAAKASTRKSKPGSSERRDPPPTRPIWKGTISFGLVTIPVNLYSMEKKSGELSFRMLDRRDHASIRYQRINEDTGKEVAWEDIVKGYEYSKDNFVILTEEDFQKAEIESSKAIEITDFVARDEVDETYFDKPYAILPAKKAEKGYVLLREVLERSGKIGIAKVAIRTREYLAAVVPKGSGLVLLVLRFAHELRSIEDFDLPRGELEAYRVSSRELELAAQLVDAMTGDWEPEQYKDEYYDALMKYIEAKAERGDVRARADSESRSPAAKATNVVDLAALLRESVKSGGKSRSAEEKSKRRRAG